MHGPLNVKLYETGVLHFIWYTLFKSWHKNFSRLKFLICGCGQCKVSVFTNCRSSSHQISIPCSSVSERAVFHLLHKHVFLIISKAPNNIGGCQFKTMAWFRAENFRCRLQHIWVFYPAAIPLYQILPAVCPLYISLARYRARLCPWASAWLVITARLAGSPRTLITPQPSKLTSCCNFLLFSPLFCGILLFLEIEK